MPELVILAAGIGSRYGGLKQIDPVGPNNQILLDYSIYDAVRSGFERVVFVIRREIESDFNDLVANRYQKQIPCSTVFQELDQLPDGIAPPGTRAKPWGTGHALWVCKAAVKQPFAVINADDYYGPSAYEQIYQFLVRQDTSSAKSHYGMVGFRLANTLSDHGSVSRGICVVDPDGYLISVTERTKIEKAEQQIRYQDESDPDGWHDLNGQEIVSMNFWGFTPDIFQHLGTQFSVFLEKNLNELKAEFYLPGAVDYLVSRGRASVSVLTSQDKWTGITNPDDKTQVTRFLKELTRKGVYPEALWE